MRQMLDQRDPVIIADTGPLLRFAAAGLLNAMRLTNRQIVIVDMVELEASLRAPDKPFAREIKDWIERSGAAVLRAKTATGVAYRALQQSAATPEEQAILKKVQRDGGERAVRDYIEQLEPKDTRRHWWFTKIRRCRA
jgi:hypothetical protein